MAARYFEGEIHAEAYAEYRQTVPVSLTARVIKFLKHKISGPLQTAVDVGCGSGQSTNALSEYFEQVFGIDISKAQIANAKLLQKHNVSFQTGPAESLPFEDSSVELVTVCQACHWFDLPLFYKEVQRILKTNGVLAILCYKLSSQAIIYKDKSEELSKIIEEMLITEPLKSHFDPRMEMVVNELKDINLPFSQQRHEFFFDRHISLEFLKGIISTWSSFQRLKKAEGDEMAQQLLDDFDKRIMDCINDPQLKSSRDLYFSLRLKSNLVMGRKPEYK